MLRVFGRVSAKPTLAYRANSVFGQRASVLSLRGYASSNQLTAGSPVFAAGKDPIVKYTENHEWIAVHDNKLAFVGITKYAADALGDTTYVEVVDTPSEVEAEGTVGSVESVKSASDVYSPVSGTVIEGNEELVGNPGLLNQDPMGAAWIAKLEIADPAELDSLMSLEEYDSSLGDH